MINEATQEEKVYFVGVDELKVDIVILYQGENEL